MSGRLLLASSMFALASAAAIPRAGAQGAPPPILEPPAPEPPRSQEDRLSAAEDRLRKQEDQIQKLLEGMERQGEEVKRLRHELAEVKAAPTPPAPPEPKLLRISGFLQADWSIFRQSSQDEVSSSDGAPLNDDRFLLRRAVIRADVERRVFLGSLALDANTIDGPKVRVLDAEVSARWQGPDAKGPPLLMGTIGLFPIPFGVEVPELDTDRFFLERSAISRALFPGNYDLGIQLKGGVRFLRYSIALMNGEPVGERSFPAIDPNGAKDFVGRIGVDVAITDRVRISAGASALAGTGFHKGTPSTKDVLVWRDANEDGLVQITEIQVIPGAAATASELFHRFAIGADFRVTGRLPRLGDLSISGEIVRASNLDRGIEPADPVGLGRDVRELGFTFGVTQEITHYAMIGVRYDRYNPDTDASEQRGTTRVPRDSTYSTLAVAAAFRYAPTRIILEYDHNGNALGRTLGGLPTTLRDDALTLRGEVLF